MAIQERLHQAGSATILPIRAIRTGSGCDRRAAGSLRYGNGTGTGLRHDDSEPITVRLRPGGYELIAGWHRLHAARLSGAAQISCIVLTPEEEQNGIRQLSEQLRSGTADYIEDAEALALLIHFYGLRQSQAAMQLGRSQSAIANKLRLLQHSPPVLSALRRYRLSERHARALLKLDSEQEKLEMIDIIVSHGLNVAATEQYMEQLSRKQSAAFRGEASLPAEILRFLGSVSQQLAQLRNAGICTDLRHSETAQEFSLTVRFFKKFR